MDNYNIVVDEEIQENLQLDAQIKSTEQQKLDDEAARKEWVSRYGLGLCWDAVSSVSSTFFLISHLQDVSLYLPDYIRKASTATLFAQGFVLLLSMALQILFMQRFGAPGSFMSQYLKLYITKSVSGKFVYLTIVLIHILTSRPIQNYLDIHGDPANPNNSMYCVLLTGVYLFYSMFLTMHGPTSIVVFPIKFLMDHRHPPHESATFYSLKLFSLLTIVIWIYIAALYEDKKYNYTAEVIAGDSGGNFMAKDVVMVAHMIVFPIIKILAFIVVTVCGCSIVVNCILLPAIQLVRRNRLVLPRNELHFE